MKNEKIAELLAVLASVVAILGATTLPFYHESESMAERVPSGARVVTLTALAEAGYWTEDEIHGGNYWNRSFRPARPVLKVGEPVVFRLKSADVIHTFYTPELGIAPVEVYPGHVREVLVTPNREGVFAYYCTTMCGDPHFAMRGVVIVEGVGNSAPQVSSPDNINQYWQEPPPPADADRAERGKWLFHQKGCSTCHGPGGRGGVPNYNYVNDTVPALNTLAEKMFLFYPEDVDAVVKALESGQPLESFEDSSPVPRFRAVLAKYRMIRDVIRNGNPAGKKDPDGPSPPLDMPAWAYRLQDQDIDSVITYLLEQRPGLEGEE